MKISKEEIKHLAELSKIELTEEETDKFQKDAEEIVGFFDKLSEAEISGEEGKKEPGQNRSEAVLDEKRESLGTGKEKEQFLEEKKGYLKIPKVFEN